MVARAGGSTVSVIALLLACSLLQNVDAVQNARIWTVIGSGSNALRDYISDGVNNATQDSDLGGLYLPFYTEGSGVGQSRFVESSVDYTVADYPLSTANFNNLGRPVVQFPLSLSAVVVYHNITGFLTAPNTLRLNASIIAQIFTGNISTWDDPRILAINPNLTSITPSVIGKNITVLVRTDSNAANQAFSKYLNTTVPDVWPYGVNTTIPWTPNKPNFKYFIGGSNLTAASSPYAILFTDAYAGKKAKLVDSAIQNKNKDWQRYASANWTFTNIGDDNISWPKSPSENWSNFSIINLGGNKTYPIPTAAFAASNTDLRDKEERGGAQKSMFGYLLGPTVAKQAAAYQVYPLPPFWLNYSLWATSLMKVRSSKTFFEPYQLANVGPPYNTAFKA